MKKTLFIFSASVLFFSCKQQSNASDTGNTGFNIDSVKAAIDAANKAFSEATSKGDSVGAASFYTKDACMVHAGENTCGTAALTHFFSEGFTKMGIKNIRITTTAVYGGKELVAEEGKYELTGTDNKTIDKGKYTVLWKEEDGKWKLYRDIGISEGAAVAPDKK